MRLHSATARQGDRCYSVLRLLDKAHIRNRHFFVHCLAHVVDSQERDTDAGEGFHLNAGLCNRPRGANYFSATLRRYDVDLHVAERHGVAKGDEMRGIFRRLNPGNPRGREDIALCDLIFGNQIERFGLEPNFSCRNRRPDAERFG